MELRDLRLFAHLARSLHFGRTSKALHVSAPTLSRIIQRLEEEVGEPLLLRDKRSVRLTHAGDAFLRFAETTLEQWQQLGGALQQHASALSGSLRLYCSVTAAYSYLLDLLPPFRQQYPAVELHLETGDAALAIDRLLAGHCDLAIAPSPPGPQTLLELLPLDDAPLLWLAPAMACPVRNLSLQQPVPWAELPLILAERGRSREQVLNWYQQQGLKPRILAEVSGHEALVSMVALGFGIGAVPRPVLEHSSLQRQVRVLASTPALGPFPVALAVRSERLAESAVQAFWQLAAQSR